MQDRSESLALVQGTSEWLDWRTQGIGGSDVAAILGMDEYRTALDVQRDKLGLGHPITETGRMRAGKILEPHVAAMYAAATGRTLYEMTPRIHRDHSWMRGSVDRMFQHPYGEQERGILEIKTTSPMNYRKVKLLGIPETWLLQLQWYLEIYDTDLGAYAILDRDSFDLIHFDYPRDRDLAANLVDHVCAWWHRHIVNREPILSTVRAEIAMPNVGGELVTIDSPEWAAAIEALRTASEIAADADLLKGEAESRVKALMIANQTDVAEGAGARVYYREQAGRKTTDYKALLADHPDIDLSKYERRGEPFRSFRVYQTQEVR